MGNILRLRHTGGGAERWVRWYQYALDSNRLLATRSPGEAGKLPFYAAAPGYNAKYTYDTHGNMTSMPHLPTMEWDFKDQLHASQKQVVNDGGTGEKTWYVYDAGGQRVRKVTETQNGLPKDERIYLSGFEVYRKYNGNRQTVTLERETLHIMDDKQRVALVETRTRLLRVDPAPRQLVRFQLGNHLGSAALELDDQAQVISYEEYQSYGTTAYEAARNQTDTPKRYRYTSKERDEQTGFSYHGARYYAGWLGRWVSCDPAGMIDGTNLYRYARNAPTSYTDSSGQDPDPPDDEQRQKDDDRLKAIGVTRQQVIDSETMPRGDFAKKYGGGSIIGEARFLWNFPSDKVRALPTALLSRVLPKTDQTVYLHPSGRTGTKASETVNRGKEIQPPTGTGAVLATAKFGVTAAITGTGEYDPKLQALGDNIEGVASGVAFARENRASNSAGVVVVDRPGAIVGTAGPTPHAPAAPAAAPPPARPQPSRIVVGRGEATGRSSIPDPKGMTTKTLAGASAKPDLISLLRNAPQKFPELVGKQEELLVERLGLGFGLTPADITGGRELLRPGGTLKILQQPTRGAGTLGEVETQIRAMLPAKEWGDIKIEVHKGEGEDALLVTAKKL